MLINRLPHAENSWQPLEKFSKRLITFPLPEASCWSWPLRSMTNTVNIRTCSQDPETLSHAPVKAWPTNTPGGILICCNLLVPVPRSFKRGGGDGGWRQWRMNVAGVHPRAHCHGLRALMWWTVPASPSWGVSSPAHGPGPHFSSTGPQPISHPALDPAPGTCLIPGLGLPMATPQLPCPCCGAGMDYSWQRPALPVPGAPPPFVYRKLLGWLPRLHRFFPDLRTQCTLVS